MDMKIFQPIQIQAGDRKLVLLTKTYFPEPWQMGGNRAKNSAIFKRVGNSGDPPYDSIWMLDPPPRTLQAPVRAVG